MFLLLSFLYCSEIYSLTYILHIGFLKTLKLYFIYHRQLVNTKKLEICTWYSKTIAVFLSTIYLLNKGNLEFLLK